MSQDSKKVAPQPDKVVRKKVSPIEVGKSYLKAEFDKIFPGEGEIRSSIDKTIDSLGEKEFWRLLEGLSFSYRLNGVFWFVSNTSYTWSEEVWSASELTLNGMTPRIDAITYSQNIDRDPIKFRDYLKDYFKKHPSNDPKGLNQFRPDSREVRYPKVMLRQKGEEIHVVDGSNRLIKMLLGGEEQVTAFIARKIKEESKMRVGDSTFWLLRVLYARSQPAEREAILKTTRRLMELSSDGRKAVQAYWIDHILDDEEIKEAGRQLLESAS